MTLKENVFVFNKELRRLVSFERLGFQDFEKDDFFYSWKLKRAINDKIDIISYGFSKDRWEDDMFLYPIQSFISFEKVSNILLSLKNQTYNFYLHEPMVVEIPDFDKKNTENYYNIAKLLFVKNKVVNIEVFNEAVFLFKDQLETSVLPYFDRIQTLQQVNDEILEKYNWREWSNYIYGKAMYKSLIIMKLCNNSNYQEFSQFYKSMVAKLAKDNADEYQDFYNTLVELLNFLDSGKYLNVI